MADTDPHPAVVLGRKRGWKYRDTADFLKVDYRQFKKIVRGFQGLSPERAHRWEELSGGELKAIDLLRWHLRSRDGSESAEAAS